MAFRKIDGIHNRLRRACPRVHDVNKQRKSPIQNRTPQYVPLLEEQHLLQQLLPFGLENGEVNAG